MKKHMKLLLVALVVTQLVIPVGAAQAMETVSLSVTGPKTAKLGSKMTFTFKLGKNVSGTCYVNLNGTGMIGYSKFSGSSTKITVTQSSPLSYSFLCTGGGKWRTPFVYKAVYTQ